jgi:phytol kinase
MYNWLGIGFVIVTLGSVMTILRWYARRYAPHPELMRKLLHICMGLTTLTLPWIFDAVWPILVLVGITVPGLWALRRSKRLKEQLGGVLHNVHRDDSIGELCFPIGVGAVFILANGDPLRFTIPVLLLTASDAVAALIGIRYGHTYYTTSDGTKSAEGSLAFFVTAFLGVCISLFLVFDGVSTTPALLIAVILSLLLMLVEAVSWQGLDNLFIPIFGFFLFDAFLQVTIADLVGNLIITLLLVIFALSWRKQAFLQDSALLCAALVGYFCWTLADWRWFIAPLTIFISHVLLESASDWHTMLAAIRAHFRQVFGNRPEIESHQQQLLDIKFGFQPYSLFAVLSVASGGLFWLAVSRILPYHEWFYLFTLAFAGQLGILMVIAQKHRQQAEAIRVTLARSIISSWLMLFIPYILMQGLAGIELIRALVGLPGVAIAVFAFYLLEPKGSFYPADRKRWIAQTACTILGSSLGFAPLFLL